MMSLTTLESLKIVFGTLVFCTVVALLAISFNNTVNSVAPPNLHVENKKIIQDVRGTAKQIYFMSIKYSGQQGAGVDSITSLQCWAGRTGLPIKIVEPVIQNTNIRLSLSAELESSECIELSEFFDMEHLNRASREAGYAEIISRREYIENNSRHVILLIILEEKGKNKGRDWTSNTTHPCYNDTLPFEYQAYISYCVVEVRYINLQSLTQLLIKLFHSWKFEDLSVVTRLWKGCYQPIPGCDRHVEKFHLLPSRRLLEDAHCYRKKYIGSSLSYTAVMIRLEHLFLLQQKHNFEKSMSIEKCIQKTAEYVKEIQRNPKEVPMIAADIGKYGSVSFYWAVKDQNLLGQHVNTTKRMMQEFFKHRVSFEEWEESFVWAAGGVTHAGYIAALQRTIASQAKCLVLLGGGHFQDLALQEYIRLHGEKERCIRILCTNNQQVLDSRLISTAS